MNSQPQRLILASQSPRRRQLLTDAGYEFEVIAPDDSVEREAVSQGLCSKCSPEELVLKSAFVKARAIATEIDSGLVLAADTVAHCQAEILGKPVDRDHAEKMLRLMSGTTHQVLTGVCIWHRPSDKFQSHIEMTSLKMDQLSEDQLKEILDSDGWVGKAGAFGYQDGLDWLHINSGLESNVVGLPIEKLDGWISELMAIVK
jgi:septum formation protein